MRLRFLTELSVLGLLISACSSKPEPTLTPRPTSTPPVALPTPTAMIVAPAVVTVVGQPTPLPVNTIASAAKPPVQAVSATPLPVSTSAPGATAATATQTPPPQATATSVTPTPPLPTLVPRAPGVSIFGVELSELTASGGLAQAKTLNARWLRRNGLFWSSVEPTEGARNWAAIAGLEQELKTASASGFETILIVRSAPSWAQQIAGSTCGSIRQDKFGAFGAFMKDAVARYSIPPYNVKYWEIWNEPDTDPSFFPPPNDSPFGCLGNRMDAYYGGGAYGVLLKTIYPQIKAASPAAQVLIGGLLMDCDPIQPPAGKDCLPSKFLEGILREGGGPYFDGVSYHGYDYYQGEGKFSNSNWNAAWNTTGPVGIVKARFIKSMLAQYNAGDKFIINTEGGLLFYNASANTKPSDAFEYTKLVYAIQNYAMSMAEGLRANIWYNMRGWFLSGLIDENNKPNAAFNGIKFLASKLQNAAFAEDKSPQYGGFKVYEFSSGGKRVWVAWSLDGSARALTLPVAPKAAYDVFAAPVAAAQTLNVKGEPVIIELD